MKRFIFTAALLGSFSWSVAQEFSIKGTLPTNANYKKISLVYESAGKRHRDTSDIVDGHFYFNGQVAETTQARLAIVRPETDKKIPNSRHNFKTFYLENAEISLVSTSSLYHAKVAGGSTQQEYNAFQDAIVDVQVGLDKSQDLTTRYLETKDRSYLDSARSNIAVLKNAMKTHEEKYIQDHPDSYITLDLVKERAGLYDPAFFEPYYKGLSDRMKSTALGKLMGQRLALSKETSVGTSAIEITQAGVDGQPISLSSLRGKYVLIDFWASWCAPCRAVNPKLVKLYKEFGGDNFEIFAVSLDSDKDAWLQAIKDDGLDWLHVSELGRWKNTAAKAYGINAVPQNILIDPKGVIVAKNLNSNNLESTLAKLIKK